MHDVIIEKQGVASEPSEVDLAVVIEEEGFKLADREPEPEDFEVD